MAKTYSTYRDFRGGLNRDSAPDALADNELEEAQNIELTERGGFDKRKGIAPLNTTSYGTQVEDVFEWLRKDGTILLLAVMDAALWNIGSDGTPTKIIDLAAGTREIWKEEFQDVLYFGDGVEAYYYNGAAAASLQVAIAPTTPILAASGNGSFSGTWQGKVVFVNAIGVESLASSAGSCSTSNSSQINWSGIQTGPAGTVKRKLYRTTANGSSFKYLATIDNNTATSYTDTIPDAYLGDTLVTDNDLTPVKRAKYAFWHSKSCRWFYAGNLYNRIALWYSEPNQPSYVKQTSLLYPTHTMGDITGIREFADAVLVFYRYGARLWRGSDPDSDVVWEGLPIKNGCISDQTVSITPNSLSFLARGGLFALSPALFSMPQAFAASEGILTNLSENKVTSVITTITNPAYTCGVYDSQSEKYLLAYSDVSASRNTKVLVLDWNLRAFVLWTGWNVNAWCQRLNGDLLFASNGYIYKTRQGYSDHGVPIHALVKTKRHHLGYPAYEKHTYRVMIDAKPGGQEQSSVNFKIVSERGSKECNGIDLTNSFVWGQKWGGVWGNSSLLQKELKAKLKGSRFQLEYSNNITDEALGIYGAVIQYKVKKPRGEKVEQNDVYTSKDV